MTRIDVTYEKNFNPYHNPMDILRVVRYASIIREITTQPLPAFGDLHRKGGENLPISGWYYRKRETDDRKVSISVTRNYFTQFPRPLSMISVSISADIETPEEKKDIQSLEAKLAKYLKPRFERRPPIVFK